MSSQEVINLKNQVNDLEDTIDDMKNNHLRHIEIKITEIKTDLKWLKKFFWLVASASTGSLVASVISLI